MASTTVGRIKGVVADAKSHAPLNGATVRLRGTSLEALVGPSGEFTLEAVPAGTYQIECTCPDYEPYRHPTIAVLPGRITKVTCRPHRGRKLVLNEPIILLPLRLEIRRHVPAAGPLPLARYELKQPEPEATRSGLYREFVGRTPVAQVTFEKAEYWIRWFPDEIHNWNFVGRFTDEEMKAWDRFYAAFETHRDADSSVKGLRERHGLDLRSLQIYYGVRPGLLSDDELQAAQSYDEQARRLIDEEGVGVREGLDWQDLHNPELKRAWVDLAREVGTVRARHIARHMTRGKWEFDTIFPIAIDIEFLRELEEGVVSAALRMALDRRLPVPLPPTANLQVQIPGKHWTIADSDSGRKYEIKNAGNALIVYGPEEGESDPLELLMDSGMPVPSLPAYLHLYTISGTRARPLLCGIPIKRDDVRISPTDLEGTHWMTDFEHAVQIGMAVKITDAEQVKQVDGAEWLIAFGADGSDDSRRALEQLFRRDNASGELSLVPNGAPTNNTEQRKTSYTEIETDAERLLAATRMRLELGEDNAAGGAMKRDPYETFDVELLKELFALDPDTLSELPGGRLAEQRDARAMATLLWTPCTHLFQHLWNKSNPGFSGWPAIRKSFIEHVRARGPFPVIRVGENPYGILPVISLRDWSPNGQEIDGVLGRFLGVLKMQFLALAARVPMLNGDGERDAFETLLEILRSNAVSNKVDVRALRDSLPLKMDQDPERITCALVKEPTTVDEGHHHGTYAETSYLFDFATDERLSIDDKSPVLKRLLHYAQNLSPTRYGASQPPSIGELSEMRAAARILERVPPAKLEVLLTEVFDLLSHRLDAWLTGLASARLKKCPSYGHSGSALGVYGWLERPGQMPTATPRAEFIQTPSLLQATTAAVFRSAAESNGAGGPPEAFRINLSSERVRAAASYLDGIRQYHDPGELVGAALERMIREEAERMSREPPDDPDLLIREADIFDLRANYPPSLHGAIDENEEPTGVPAVVDGLKFLADMNTHQKYATIKARLESIPDAGADLGLWEAVDQLVRGNYARAAAWMEFFEGECLPPELQSIKMARTGDVHGTKVLLPLVPPDDYADSPTVSNPRVVADPILAWWCENLFADFREKQIVVEIWRVDGPGWRQIIVTPGQLDMEPIDLLVGGVEELKLRARYAVLKRWQSCDPSEVDCPYAVLGAFPRFDESDELLNEVGIEVLLSRNEADPCNLCEQVERATHLRRLLHRRQSKDRPIAVPPTQLTVLAGDTAQQLDHQATLEELSRRFSSIASRLASLLIEIVRSAATLKARHLTRRRLERRAADVGYIKVAYHREQDVASCIAAARAKIAEMLAAASETGDLGDVKDSILSEIDQIQEAAATDSGETPALIERAREHLAKSAAEFEEVVAETAATLLTAESIPFQEISRFGAEKALTVLPDAPTFVGSTKIVGLLDRIVQELAAKINLVHDAVPTLADHCAALGAMFARPGRVHRIVSSVAEKEMRLQALSQGLQLTQGQAAILDRLYGDGGESFLSATAVLCEKIAAELTSLTLAPLSVHPDGAIQDRISRTTSWLQELTDREAMIVLTPFFLKMENKERPRWKLDISSLNLRSLDEFEAYRFVRPAVSDALTVFNADVRLNMYEDQRRQRSDGEGIRGRAEGNTDFLYLAADEQLEGYCLTCLMIDEWFEGFPNMSETTAIALRYDSPQAEAPQALLVAAPPRIDEEAEWTTDLLANTLLETIELFKVRLVGSKEVIGSGNLGHLLPALLFGPAADGNRLFPSHAPPLFPFDIPGGEHYVMAKELKPSELAVPKVQAKRGIGRELDQ